MRLNNAKYCTFIALISVVCAVLAACERAKPSTPPPEVTVSVRQCSQTPSCPSWLRRGYCNVVSHISDVQQTRTLYVDTWQRTRLPSGEEDAELIDTDIKERPLPANSTTHFPLITKNCGSVQQVTYQCYRASANDSPKDCFATIPLWDRAALMTNDSTLKDMITPFGYEVKDIKGSDLSVFVRSSVASDGCREACDQGDLGCVSIPFSQQFFDWETYGERYENIQSILGALESASASELNTILDLSEACEAEGSTFSDGSLSVKIASCILKQELGRSQVRIAWPNLLVLTGQSFNNYSIASFDLGANVDFIKSDGTIDSRLSAPLEEVTFEPSRVIFGIGEYCYKVEK